MFPKKRKDLLPAIDCLLLAVRGAMMVKKSVTGAIVSVEFIILIVLFEFCFVLINLFRCGVTIIVPENSQDRAG